MGHSKGLYYMLWVKNFFFSKFFVHNISRKIFKRLAKYGFLKPFGFVFFLQTMYNSVFGKKVRSERKLFLKITVPVPPEDPKKKKPSKYSLSEIAKRKAEKKARLLRERLDLWKIFSRNYKKVKRNVFFRKRKPSFISRFFFRQIFAYKYRLFLFLKRNLQVDLRLLLNSISKVFSPFIQSLFSLLKGNQPKVKSSKINFKESSTVFFFILVFKKI